MVSHSSHISDTDFSFQLSGTVKMVFHVIPIVIRSPWKNSLLKMDLICLYQLSVSLPLLLSPCVCVLCPLWWVSGYLNGSQLCIVALCVRESKIGLLLHCEPHTQLMWSFWHLRGYQQLQSELAISKGTYTHKHRPTDFCHPRRILDRSLEEKSFITKMRVKTLKKIHWCFCNPWQLELYSYLKNPRFYSYKKF